MTILSIFAAAIAAWLFGAVWYGLIAKPWMAATGLTEETINRSDPAPYVVSFVCAVIVAAMTHYILQAADITGVAGATFMGLALGLFIAVPWMATNVMFQKSDRALIWMDGGYPAIGMALMGLVLALL